MNSKERLWSAQRQYRHNNDNSPDLYNPDKGFVCAYDPEVVDQLVAELDKRIEQMEHALFMIRSALWGDPSVTAEIVRATCKGVLEQSQNPKNREKAMTEPTQERQFVLIDIEDFRNELDAIEFIDKMPEFYRVVEGSMSLKGAKWTLEVGFLSDKQRAKLQATLVSDTASPQTPQKPSIAERYPQYYRDVRGYDVIDVYGVHHVFDLKDPSGCLPHASKKILLSGVRTGGKSKYQDIKEARDTLNRWLELNEGMQDE